MTSSAYFVRPSGPVWLENNLATGRCLYLLNVSGLDGGFLPDAGPAFAPLGYVERNNDFDRTSLQALFWDNAVNQATYLMLSGQGSGTVFVNPNLASTDPTNPDFTPGSAVRDLGTPNPASGALTPGCDGGLTTYCGAAPEMGAVELIP
jgi:hypothetical protein